MNDLMGKIGDLLSDEESVKQLSELAQLLMSDGDSEENSSSSENTAGDEEDNTVKKQDRSEEGTGDGLFPNGFDFSSLMKLQGIMGAMNQKDKNSELLIALKPHLREEKREKVDKALKILKILAVWNVIRDSGLLKDLL